MRRKPDLELGIEEVPSREGEPIWRAAGAAKALGRRIFTCSVTVGHTEASGFGPGGKRSTTVKRWDPALLIESIEALGWRLEHMDHVWAQTNQNASLGTGSADIGGLIIGHMQFRSTEASLQNHVQQSAR